MRILHVAAHLGGGAGKAIAGIILSGRKSADSTIVLLDEPQNKFYVNLLIDGGIPVYVKPDGKEICRLISENDIIIFDWWGHPLMIEMMINLPQIKFRAIIWNHINGCSYPYLPSDFIRKFEYSLYTSKYSFENALWNSDDKEYILNHSDIVYGIGDFNPESVTPKNDYSARDNFIVGYSGTLNYAKINPEFLKYYGTLIERIPNIKFLMLGDPSEELMNDIKRLGMEKYFEFPGYVSNVMDYLREMNVFAYLLNRNSYATTENSLIEAMAVGLPIIVLNNPVERHIIYKNINGYLVNSEKEFCNLVCDLENESKAGLIGQLARKYCKENYSPKGNSDKLYKVCAHIMKFSKREHHFFEGKNVFDIFCYFSGNEGELFRDIVERKIENADIIEKIPHIYREKGKASFSQYLRVFPNDEKLKYLIRMVSEHEN